MSLPNSLRVLYKKGAGRKEIFDLLATYRNRVSDTNADRCSELADVPYDQTVLLFKELDELKVGSFKVGRRGGKTRIDWHYGPGAVGRVAQGRDEQLEPYDADEEILEEPTVEAEGTIQEQSPSRAAGLSFGQIIEKSRKTLADQLGIAPEKIEITIKP